MLNEKVFFLKEIIEASKKSPEIGAEDYQRSGVVKFL